MFPITHIWFAEKILDFRDPSVILGAIFPDIVITGCLDYKQTHYCGKAFYSYLQNYCPVFAKAMATHTVNPRGLDYYGDESYQSGYRGYCFQKAFQIEKLVIDACNIPESFGLWKAHNFIEMAIEIDVAVQQQYLIGELHSAFEDNAVIEAVAAPIENYFGLKKDEMKESFKRFSQYIEMDNYNCHTLAVKYDLQMQSKHGISIDVHKASEIINQSSVIVRNEIQEFFQYCCREVKLMVKGGS